MNRNYTEMMKDQGADRMGARVSLRNDAWSQMIR